MHKPIVLLVGQANSGKDTVANIICKHYNGQSLALADPIKRLAKFIFDFEDRQLWGPSSTRGEVLDRFNPQKSLSQYQESWQMAYGKVLLAEALLMGPEVSQFFPEGFKPTQLEAFKAWVCELQESLIEQNKVLTPRIALQSLGTEFGRTHNPTMWIDVAKNNINRLLEGGVSYSQQNGLVQSGKSCDWVIISDGRFENEIRAVKSMGGLVAEVVNRHATEMTTGIEGHASEEEQKRLSKDLFNFRITNDKTKGLDALALEVFMLMDKLSIVRYLGQKSRRDEP